MNKITKKNTTTCQSDEWKKMFKKIKEEEVGFHCFKIDRHILYFLLQNKNSKKPNKNKSTSNLIKFHCIEFSKCLQLLLFHAKHCWLQVRGTRGTKYSILRNCDGWRRRSTSWGTKDMTGHFLCSRTRIEPDCRINPQPQIEMIHEDFYLFLLTLAISIRRCSMHWCHFWCLYLGKKPSQLHDKNMKNKLSVVTAPHPTPHACIAVFNFY